MAVQTGGGDRFAFIVDWLDPHASIKFKYQLMYYVADGSMEMVRTSAVPGFCRPE